VHPSRRWGSPKGRRLPPWDSSLRSPDRAEVRLLQLACTRANGASRSVLIFGHGQPLVKPSSAHNSLCQAMAVGIAMVLRSSRSRQTRGQ
jgi:hypothetical protein